MARAGIYKSEVVRARKVLLAQGRYPSIDAIRNELGTGSKGTIHRYLKEIEEEEGAPTGTQVAVSDAIQDLVARLAERLHEESDAHVAEATAKHTAALRELQETMATAQKEYESFRKQLERSELALAEEKSRHAETEAKLQAEMRGNSQLSQQVVDFKERIAAEERHRLSLEEKHQHAREALEHFRQSVKEQRDQEQRQHDQQIQYLQGELHTVKDSLATKQSESIQSHQDNLRLSNELAHTKTELHQAQSELRALRQTREQLVAAEHQIKMLGQQVKERDTSIAEFSEKTSGLEVRVEELKATTQRLEVELSAAQAIAKAKEQMMEDFRGHLAGPSNESKSRQEKNSSTKGKAGKQEGRFEPGS